MAQKSSERIESKLRRLLPDEVFQPAASRLLWLPVHYAVIAAGTSLIVWTDSLWAKLSLSLLVGLSFAGLAFVAHEALHGALTKNRNVRRMVGVLGFFPFCLSPRLWIAWHNRVHHGGANIEGRDPDALASLDEYKKSAQVRASTHLQARTRGLFTLLLGFSIQSLQVLASAGRYRILGEKKRRLAWLDFSLMASLWVGLGFALGWTNWIFFYFLPLLVGNAIVMMHIVTNHGLSPLTEENDSLLTSLSVTVPRVFSFYTLDFGYHTEHHLLPGVSLRHGKAIREKILELAPERYQSMPLSAALLRFFEQLRVYRDPVTLLDPWTGRTRPALQPGDRRSSPPPSNTSRSPARSRPPLRSPATLRPARP